jgi:hypothetical protein
LCAHNEDGEKLPTAAAVGGRAEQKMGSVAHKKHMCVRWWRRGAGHTFGLAGGMGGIDCRTKVPHSPLISVIYLGSGTNDIFSIPETDVFGQKS